jgi:lysozyme
MKTSQRGIDLIKAYEGIRDGDPSTVNLDPYLCPANVATIGWGHAIVDPDTGLQLKGREGLKRARELFPDGITLEEAEALLRTDLEERERDVSSLVKVYVSQGQFDALVSFAFNVGTDIDADSIAEGLGDSTLLRKLNYQDYAGAAAEFPKWNKSEGRVLLGLTRRRQAERDLFLEGTRAAA